MQKRTCSLFAVTLSTLFFGISAIAADLPKEGTFSGTYAAFTNTVKATPIGKERLLLTFDQNGLTALVAPRPVLFHPTGDDRRVPPEGSEASVPPRRPNGVRAVARTTAFEPEEVIARRSSSRPLAPPCD